MNLKPFEKHVGVWEGSHIRIDENGKELYRHRTRTTVQIVGNTWTHTNEYFWEDGRHDIINLGVSIFDENAVLHYDNDRLIGKSWATHQDLIVLYWTYKNVAGSLVYEIITRLEENHRVRTWQHSQDGIFKGITMVEEWRTIRK